MKGKVMKKYMILMVSIFFMMTSVVLADDAIETCANGAGRIVTGKITGNKYCMSETKMNWWNAVTWCDGLGQQIFSLNDCECTASNNCTNVCPELVIDSTLVASPWVANPKGISGAYAVDVRWGTVVNTSRSYTNFTLCK